MKNKKINPLDIVVLLLAVGVGILLYSRVHNTTVPTVEDPELLISRITAASNQYMDPFFFQYYEASDMTVQVKLESLPTGSFENLLEEGMELYDSDHTRLGTLQEYEILPAYEYQYDPDSEQLQPVLAEGMETVSLKLHMDEPCRVYHSVIYTSNWSHFYIGRPLSIMTQDRGEIGSGQITGLDARRL